MPVSGERICRAPGAHPLYAALPGGATLYFSDEGEGPALVFVHGWTCDSTDFLEQIHYFRGRYRVIAPDLRGHGRSSAPGGGYEARVFARDLIHLLDHLRVADCVAVGHSLGGVIVSAMAVEHPERIRGVVCLDPAYGVAAAAAAACDALIVLMDRSGWPQQLAGHFGDWEGPDLPVFFRELHPRRMLAMDPDVVRETFSRLFAGADPLGRRARSADYLARRICPVLAIYGRDAAERADWERETATHSLSRVLHMPLGHWLHQEAPEAVNRHIARWLEDIAYGPAQV